MAEPPHPWPYPEEEEEGLLPPCPPSATEATCMGLLWVLGHGRVPGCGVVGEMLGSFLVLPEP